MPTSYRFTGQREDTTGLYFYNARYYDPVVGRFAQADTIVPQPGNPQSLNRYTYARNNPVCYNDPSGHFAWWVTAGIGLAIDVAADAVIAKVTGDKFDLASSVATNVVMNVATAGLGGKLAKMGKLTKVVQQGLKHGDEAAKAAAPFAEHVLKRGVPLAHGLGEWVRNAPNMSGAASAFQRYVTGAESGWEFLRNGVHFDGIRSAEGGRHVLMDAKYAGASAESFYSKVGQDWAAASVLDEAYRQIKAAGGFGIEWYISDEVARESLERLFRRNGIAIDVILAPWQP